MSFTSGAVRTITAPVAQRIPCFLALLLICSAPVPAKGQDTTAAPAPSRLFSKRDAVLAGAFLAVTIAAAPTDRYFARLMQDSSNQSDAFVRLVSTDISWVGRPGLLIVGPSLLIAGRLAHLGGVAHFGLHATEAMLLSEAATTMLKVGVGRARPRDDINSPFNFGLGKRASKQQFRSFPSSHAGDAFAFAAVATEEVARGYPHARWCVHGDLCIPPAWIVGAVAYSGAATIGLTRMYNNEHWGSDVLMGAAIGTFSGLKVVQYNHLHRNTRLDRWLLSTTVSPTISGGMAVSWSTVF